jgi:hypothetical protein
LESREKLEYFTVSHLKVKAFLAPLPFIGARRSVLLYDLESFMMRSLTTTHENPGSGAISRMPTRENTVNALLMQPGPPPIVEFVCERDTRSRGQIVLS